MRNDTLIISGEPDTRRRVSPVPREGLGDLSSSDDKAPLPYPTICYRPARWRTFLKTAILCICSTKPRATGKSLQSSLTFRSSK